MTCTASPRYCLENADLIPEDLGSPFSREGNTAHEVAAAFLQDRQPDPANCPVPIDAEMRMHGWDYAEYVQGLREKNSLLFVEQKTPLWYYEGRNAIVDAAVSNPLILHIVDYKYGAGVVVEVKGNKQLAIYARQVAGPMNLSEDFPIHCHIFQPRSPNSVESPAHVWETTWGEIKAITDDIAANAYIILNNNRVKGPMLDFEPSEKACRWCPAKGFCPARQKELLDGIEALDTIETKPLPVPPVIPIEQLAAILKHRKQIIQWLNDAEEYALERMKEGHEVPGFKLVLSRGGNRYWVDPKEAARLLVSTTILKRGEVVEEKTISPAAVEKLLGKKNLPTDLMALITRSPGGPEIAPVEDKREEYLLKAENEFEPLGDPDLDTY